MQSDRELMQQALEALDEMRYAYTSKGCHMADNAITALRERLAQPEQEPVAYTTGYCENHKQKGGCQLHNLQCGWPDCDRKPITTPPQRPWVGLTDAELAEFSEAKLGAYDLCLEVEAKLFEKNGGKHD